MAESHRPVDMPELRVRRDEYLRMLRYLEEQLPLEGCGMLAGRDGLATSLYEIRNHLASPYAYEMDPEQQLMAMIDMENQGLELLALFHSHPSGPEFPSASDVATAYYPDAYSIIVSFSNVGKPSAKAFAIRDGQVGSVRLTVV